MRCSFSTKSTGEKTRSFGIVAERKACGTVVPVPGTLHAHVLDKALAKAKIYQPMFAIQ